jgi:hypothetical protein
MISLGIALTDLSAVTPLLLPTVSIDLTGLF